MRYLRGIVTWIAQLESGGQFRLWISVVVKILGVLLLIGTLVGTIVTCVGAIAAGSETVSQMLAVIGSIPTLLINIVLGVLLIILFYNRANVISTLGTESHLTLLPITFVLIRLFGEASFLSLVGTGIQGVVSSIFGWGFMSLGFIDLLDIFPRDLQAFSFIFGVIVCVSSIISGIVILVFTYFLAELINLLTDMASNLKKIETTVSTEESPEETCGNE